jgi:hypothetical protein
VQEIGRDLGVRFVLEGGIRKVGNRDSQCAAYDYGIKCTPLLQEVPSGDKHLCVHADM